jgi:riboflavin synthase
MFTGLITDVGDVVRVEPRGDLRVRIACGYPLDSVDIGASIACDGACLTVAERGPADRGCWFEADVSAETLEKTMLSDWRAGSRVNLEGSLRLGDEMGGHIVSGHVDGVAEVVSLTDEGASTRIWLRAPEALAPFIASKGSVALGGVSLTVNEVAGVDFSLNLIPHTKQVTTWGDIVAGDKVNLEIDTLARYVARLKEFGA